MFKTIKENVSAEIVEKKSKFIANIYYVETKKQAEGVIDKVNKKYHDARHNCYAYRIIENNNIIEKFSDDGEPSGTAGAPLLTVISKNDLANILVIVTRYFGGILLGTGGLVKAYSEACIEALKNVDILEKKIAKLYIIEIPYTELSKIKYVANKNNIEILKEEYLQNIKLEIASEKELNSYEFINTTQIIKVEFIKEIYI